MIPYDLIEEKKLSHMVLNMKLPQTNCKECGEIGCFAFASKLFIGEKSVRWLNMSWTTLTVS